MSRDHPSQRTGTGIAYVQFSSPEEAERARHSRHKQMMGPRYIECMVFVPGQLYSMHYSLITPLPLLSTLAITTATYVLHA